MEQEDHQYMLAALNEARKAEEIGEVPIGAVIVKDGKIIGRGYNMRETSKDPTAHAELLAIKEASQTLGGWRLTGSTLYVTLEPCPMCAGALVQARVDRVVYGVCDPKAGCAGTLMNLLKEERFNHQVIVESGILAEDCSTILKLFFRKLRERKREKKISITLNQTGIS
ncbi:MAG TPA: tRNA adenosine(34) deaminase TadA [Bacillota bacterium]|nr:tRNA adenosine(34) deaminase TadA [Bacillota bacterium]